MAHMASNSGYLGATREQVECLGTCSLVADAPWSEGAAYKTVG